MATPNGLEPSTSSVTGWRANRLHHEARCCHRKPCNAVDDFLHITQNPIIVICYLVTLDSLLSAYVTNAPFIFPAVRGDHSAGHGAGGRTRTGTMSPSVDFESTTSTNSITPADSDVKCSDEGGNGMPFSLRLLWTNRHGITRRRQQLEHCVVCHDSNA